ncbi:hypothetical protein ZIOFF_032203 [Zingiber officinale]|uniref:4-hydroxy-7-methoxy-3-oxo-3,4-dihydro-2H-1,4-benzoxazin-2-yl glucosidebeta-D-glucosidase n=1 Tax=Zingiber officinale TaxID=94328 RepID=A0A8J5LBF6_ZINOF|nr:hypothetical protein ZIOFF_032203 [Zingiber officinale]
MFGWNSPKWRSVPAGFWFSLNMANRYVSVAFPGFLGVPPPLRTCATKLLTYAAAFSTVAPNPPPPNGQPISDTTISTSAAPAFSSAACTKSTMASNRWKGLLQREEELLASRTPLHTKGEQRTKELETAADQYHKYKEDVKLMHDMGLDAYRFSISWSRVIPNGRGPVNPEGVQYYNNLINELKKYGIEPHVTLLHFDLPQSLEDEYSGFLSPKIVEDFTAYADVCFREFGDRVKYWITVNEPNIEPILGHDLGIFPPNHCSSSLASSLGLNCSNGNSSVEPYVAGHNLLLSHASAVSLYRKKYQVSASVSLLIE